MQQTKSQTYLGYLFAFFIAAIPLVHFSSIADPTLLSRQIYFSITLLIGMVLIWFKRNNNKLSIPKPIIILSLLWIFTAFTSHNYALNKPEAWYNISKIALYISAIGVTYLLVQTKTISLKQLSLGVVSASIIALIQLVFEINEKQAIGTNLWQQKNLYELQTAFGHKNLYSSFQLLCLPFYIYLLLDVKKWWKISVWMLYSLVIISICLIQTKSVILGLALAISISIPLASGLFFQEKRKLFYLIIGSYLTALIAVFSIVYLYPSKFTLLLNNDTIHERILLWTNTYKMIQEHFPFGVGPGNWQVYFPKYGLGDFMKTNYLVSDGYTTFQRPHSDFLWVLSELGIVGLLAYIGVFIYVIYRGIRHIKSSEEIREKIWLFSFLLALIAYLFVASVDFPLERNEHQFVLAIILCIILGSNRNEEKQSSLNKNLLLISITFLLVFSTVYSLLRLPNEQHAKKMVQAHMNSNWERILKEAKQINPNLFTIDNFSIPIAWYKGLAHYSMGNKEKAKESFTEAYQINPYQVHVLNNMAGMFEQEGKHTQALVYYDKLLAISPKQPDALLNKSAVLYNEKRYDEAMACIYKLKYDEKNDQFLLYLNAIGKAYLEKKLHESPDIPMEAKENKEYIKNFFIINQKMNRTFDELQIIPYE